MFFAATEMQPRGWSELGRTVTVQRGSSDRGSESPGAGEERGRASQQLTVAGCRVEAVCRAEQSAELVRNTEDSRLATRFSSAQATPCAGLR